MKRENLRKILESENDIAVKIDQILDSYHSEIEPLKADLKLAQDEKSGLEEQLQTANDTIANLEKNAESSESVAQEIESYKSQIQDLIKARDDEKVNNAIEMAILQAKGKNAKAIRALLDDEKIKLESDGSVSGIEEQLKTLAKTDAYMFETEEKKEAPAKSTGYNGPKGTAAGEQEKTNKSIERIVEQQNKQNKSLAPKPLFGE